MQGINDRDGNTGFVSVSIERNKYQFEEQREKFMSELLVELQGQTIYRIQQQYDYESLQNEMNKKIISRHRIILIISALLLVATMVILFLQYKQKRLMEAEAELESHGKGSCIEA